MDTRKKVLLLLIIAGIIVFGALRSNVAPETVKDEQKTSDYGFESISKYTSLYMGDASNIGNLFRSLPLNDVEMTIELHPETLSADVNYKQPAAEAGIKRVQAALFYNSTAAFTLIDNLEALTFKFPDISYRVLRSDVESFYGGSLKALADKGAWDKTVQSRLGDEEYVQGFLKSAVGEVRARTSVEEAIMSYYDNTKEPVVIYEQIPFEDGKLVLAEKLTDGEHYPELHYIDKYHRTANLTRGSYCWTLNYTQFKGYYIYFGLAGAETHLDNKNPSKVKKVEAVFADRTASAIPNDSLISYINPVEGDTRMFKSAQGYILPVKGRDLPYDFTAVLENGKRLSLSGNVIKSSLNYMPDYLKSKKQEVYNSFAFTYTPMLTPEEWDKGYKDGEIGLLGKTDANGNRNVLYLRPAGNMKLTSSYVVPLDIKPLYLSDNFPRLAAFEAGEEVELLYPSDRELMSCSILKVTREKAEQDIRQDSFKGLDADKEGKLVLPEEKGYYLFLLKTRTNKDIEMQTYTGMLVIK